MAVVEAKVGVVLACLGPWLPALRQLDSPDGNKSQPWEVDASRPFVVWFNALVLIEAKRPKVSLDRVCEALSLLALVARGGVRLWKRLLLEVWTGNLRVQRWLEAEPLPTKFEIGVDVPQVRVGWACHITRFSDQITCVASKPSPEYSAARAFLMKELLIRDEDRNAGSTIRVRIEFDAFGGRTTAKMNAQMLQYALEVVRTQSSLASGGEVADRAPRFTVTNVDLPRDPPARIDMIVLRCMQELAVLGIPPIHLPPLTMSPSRDALPTFVQALRDLAGLDDGSNRGVSTISIDDKLSSWPVIRATLTAAQQSSSARTIELSFGGSGQGTRLGQNVVDGEDDGEDDDEDEDDDDEDDDQDDDQDDREDDGEVRETHPGIRRPLVDRDHLGGDIRIDEPYPDQRVLSQWIAFTIFSRRANHSIDALELNAELLQAFDMDAMRRVLNAPNPYAVVRGRPGVVPGKSVPRQLVASRFVLQHPGQEDLGPPFLAKKPIAVRILQTPDTGVFPWYEVLLPGYGDAWVQEDDVVSTSDDDLHISKRQVTSLPEFRSIAVSISDASMSPVADLMALIGHGTQRIRLEHTGTRGLGDWCANMMLAYPKLEELNAERACIDNLNTFEAAARAGLCRLQELSSPFAAIGHNAQHLHKFFEALSDNTHPLTEHLRELEVGMVFEAESHQLAIEPMIRMLTRNRRLVKIQLTLMFRDAFDSLCVAFRSAIDNRKIGNVLIRTGPLDLRCKLAFISAVDQKTRICVSAQGQLDSSVLSIVLQFAAEGRPQVCSIAYEEYPRRFVF